MRKYGAADVEAWSICHCGGCRTSKISIRPEGHEITSAYIDLYILSPSALRAVIASSPSPPTPFNHESLPSRDICPIPVFESRFWVLRE
ncbi:hypothetical protein BD413DRAFT_152029 [Trametes elegans]|nr:hypothetical protein BD413DRAFT_152029 [Trametes elegans]